MGPNLEPPSDSRRLSLRRSLLVWVACAMLGWVVGLVSLYYVIRTNETITAQQRLSPSDSEAIADSQSPDATDKQPSVAEIEELRKIAPAAGPSGAATGPSTLTPESVDEMEAQDNIVAPPSDSEAEVLDDIAPAAGPEADDSSEELIDNPPIMNEQ